MGKTPRDRKEKFNGRRKKMSLEVLEPYKIMEKLKNNRNKRV